MAAPVMQPANFHLTCLPFGIPPAVQLKEVPPTKILTTSDFPRALVTAIGEENLANMPQVAVNETGTGYLDGYFSLRMIPESGAIKGTDQYGRVFVAFAVSNSNYQAINEAAEQSDWDRHKAKEVALFTVLQRYEGSGDINKETFCHRSCHSIPTNDARFFGNCYMDPEKYQAIKEVFDGTHKDLTLGLPKEKKPLSTLDKV